MLTTAPSGDFTPIIDSYGRIVFTRWDHLKRDQQFDADILGDGTAFGTFNFTDEGKDAGKYYGDIEVFPEPLSTRQDLLTLPEWQHVNPININVFTPWMVNEDGTEIETLNHFGRHELGRYFSRNFTNDENLSDFVPIPEPIRNMFHIKESPITPGLYFGKDAPEFATHSSGMIISLQIEDQQSADSAIITYLTHPDTKNFTDNPSTNHSGLYRNLVPLSNGFLIASHTFNTREDANDGTLQNPKSRFDFRLRYLEKKDTYYSATTTLTTGISKNLSWWGPDALISYDGVLWETFPVEVRARPKPTKTTLHTPVPIIEQTLFEKVGVSIEDLKKFLVRNNLALVVARNVTSRDDKDQQQPYNLKVTDSNTQTINPDHPDNVYEVKYLQYLQGDQIRGIGARNGLDDPNIDPGRRILAQYMHDENALRYNLPTTGNEGSINIASDGSVAAVIPANRAMTWQLTDADNRPIVRERVWLSFQAGEIRVCTSCHGENDKNQAGFDPPSNEPMALTQLLNQIKGIDTDADKVVDIYDDFPLDNSRQTAGVFHEDFSNQLNNWITTNIDADAAKWEATSTACNEHAVVIKNQLAATTNEIDQMSHYIDLTDLDQAALSFDLAYASATNSVNMDELSIKVIACDSNDETTIYRKAGNELVTSNSSEDIFIPTDCSQWRTEVIDLSKFIGQEITIVFENHSGRGNQLFLDNIIIKQETVLSTSIKIPIEDIQLQVYPNPLSHYTTVSYHLPKGEQVSLKMIDILGNTVHQILHNSTISPGSYKTNISTEQLFNGTYFIQFQMGDKVLTERVLVIK